MRIFNEIAKRGVAVLLLAVTVFGAITYSLGYYEFSFIDRDDPNDSGIQNILGTLAPGTDISDFTGDTSQIIPPQSTGPDSGTSAPGTSEGTSGNGTTSEDTGTSNPPPPQQLTLAEYLAAGYSVSWYNFTPEMIMAEVSLPVDSLDMYTLGNYKRVNVRLKEDYGEGHKEFPYYSTRYEKRPTVEVYMGYIIVDSGKGSVKSGISDRLYEDVFRVSIYTSAGKFIGIYPSEEVVPANNRDRSDRPMFVLNRAYYYLDERTGTFALSDFAPERDGRGLEFDYNPDFGKSDNKYNIYYTEQTITETFTLKNTASYYIRYSVDGRLAEQLYLYYPKLAANIAAEYSPGLYYNRLFAAKLKEVVKGVESGVITRPPETTTEAPETDPPAPETSEIPETSVDPGTTAPETTVDPGTTAPETTVDPGITTAPETTVDPDVTTAPETTVEPDVTTAPETTVEPDVTTASETETEPEPDQTSHVITENTVPVASRARTIISESEDKDNDGIPDTIKLDISYQALRFTYRASQPKVDLSKITTTRDNTNEFVSHVISWKSDFKYAKAFNFSENRAYTVDDNGVVKIINTSGSAAIYLDNVYFASSDIGGYYRYQYYTEPFERDEYKLGHYYFNDGLIRMRVVERRTNRLYIYERDYEVILDADGNQYSGIPAGFEVVSYSDGIFLLKRDDRYGYYHRDGYWVAQPIYTYAAPFIEGLAVLGFEDGIKGVIDSTGKIVIPFVYNEISNASTGIFACYSEDKGWKVFAKLKK